MWKTRVYLAQDFYFVEATYPIALRSVLLNRDLRWQLDCMRQGRQSQRSLYCGIDNSRTYIVVGQTY